MDKYTATEVAYKNGFEQGQRVAAEHILGKISKELHWHDGLWATTVLSIEVLVADLKYEFGVDI
jgi:hypothetical protein